MFTLDESLQNSSNHITKIRRLISKRTVRVCVYSFHMRRIFGSNGRPYYTSNFRCNFFPRIPNKNLSMKNLH